jgi:hypothetical protein
VRIFLVNKECDYNTKYCCGPKVESVAKPSKNEVLLTKHLGC